MDYAVAASHSFKQAMVVLRDVYAIEVAELRISRSFRQIDLDNSAW